VTDDYSVPPILAGVSAVERFEKCATELKGWGEAG